MQDAAAIESRIRMILDRKVAQRATGPYVARNAAQVTAMLERALSAAGYARPVISDVVRMAGGASKEQFSFTLAHGGAVLPVRLVLRMDPLESIAQTCRGREAQIQSALAGTVPVPPVLFCDADGEILGQPGMISFLVPGVTRPTDVDAHGVSGMGSRFDDWAPKLAPQFVGNLVKIHAFNWRRADLSYFTPPAPGTNEAAIFQVNWWSTVWRQDMVEPVPMITLAGRWLRHNAPVCEKPVVVHADYRMGNFMFAEPSGDFTAILDWELSHIGDFHEDIAWALLKLFGAHRADGVFLVSGLLPRADFLRQYEAASGNVIDPVKLRYYEVLNAYKCAVMDLGAAITAGIHGNSHQDLVLTWLASAGAVFLQQLVTLIREA